VGAIREDVRDLAQSVREQLKDMVTEFKKAGQDSGAAIGDGIAAGSGGAGGGIGQSIEETINSELKNINVDDFVIDDSIFKTANEGRAELRGVGKELRSIEEIAAILDRAPGWSDFGDQLRDAAGNIEGHVGGARDKFSSIMKQMNEIMRTQNKTIKEAIEQLGSTIASSLSGVAEQAGTGVSQGTNKATGEVAESARALAEKWGINLTGALDRTGIAAGDTAAGVGDYVSGGLESASPGVNQTANDLGTEMGESLTTGMETGAAGAVPSATEAGNSVGGAFNSGVASNIPSAQQLGSQISNAVLESLRASAIADTEAVRMIGEAFGNAFGTGVAGGTPEATQSGVALTDATEVGMNAGLPSAENTAGNVGEAIGGEVATGLETACKPVNTAARDISTECAGGGIEAGEKTAVNAAENTGEAIGEGVADGMNAAGTDVEKQGKELGLDSVKAVQSAITNNQALMKTSVTTMVNNSAIDPTSQAKPMGTEFINGMIDGLNNQSGVLYTTIQEIVRQGIDKAKEEAGIVSPSKEMRTVGDFMGQGLALGVEQQRDPVVDTMRSVVEEMIKAANVGEVEVGTLTMAQIGDNLKMNARELDNMLQRSTDRRLRTLDAYTSNRTGKALAESRAASDRPPIQVGDIVLKEGDPGYSEGRGFINAISKNHPAYYGTKRR
jgi:hypothetical protein